MAETALNRDVVGRRTSKTNRLKAAYVALVFADILVRGVAE